MVLHMKILIGISFCVILFSHKTICSDSFNDDTIGVSNEMGVIPNGGQ